MFKHFSHLILLGLISMPTLAAETAKGKIIFTQGHVVANCRTVKFRENQTGRESYFRIADTTNNVDVSAVVLAAMPANRDVTIFYYTNKTSGCGTEPRIEYITVF